MTIKHSRLRHIGWQLRLADIGPKLEFVPVSDADFMAKPPTSWGLLMLELNWDIYDASKKLVIGSVNMSNEKTEETIQMWITTLGELRGLMEHRARLLIWQPLTKHEHLNSVPLPHGIDDKYGAPPVVVWLGPKLKEKAGGKPSEPGWGHRSVRQWWAWQPGELVPGMAVVTWFYPGADLRRSRVTVTTPREKNTQTRKQLP